MRTQIVFGTAMMLATLIGIDGADATKWQGSDHKNQYAAVATSNTFQVATQCNDGSESNSTGSGTCSHHGGERK